MHFMPILSTLRRHKTAAALIVLEIALTCAIVCNAVFLIRDRLERMDRDSGAAEAELLRVQITGIGERADAAALTEQDLVALRRIPGVKLAAATNMVPFGGSSWNTSISTIADDPNPPINAAMYMGTKDLVETLGVRITSGRNFTPDELASLKDVQEKKAPMVSVMISQGVAAQLFPGENAVGKSIYVWGKEPQRVVGVFERLARPNDFQGRAGIDDAMILPVTVAYTEGGNYILRVDPTRTREVLAAIDKTLNDVDPARIILDKHTFGEVRRNHFRQDRSMAYLLVGVSLALLVITALGVIGLASFWVQQRTRQIGIRRALGATRSDIRRYFQLENFILASIGIILGMALAYGLNILLMHKYQVARLPAVYLPSGAVMLWIIGQIAVLGPALRAATIPPAIATRSV